MIICLVSLQCQMLGLREILLLFTVFDGYLENKYRLIEGESFRKHYEALPEIHLWKRSLKIAIEL